MSCLQDWYKASAQLGAEPPVDLPDMLLVAFNMLPRTPLTPKAQARRPGRVHDELIHASASVFGMIERRAAVLTAWKQWLEEKLDAELAGDLFLAAAARRNAAAMALLEKIKPGAVPAAASQAAITAAGQSRPEVDGAADAA
jgi:hypothetical protein